MSRARILLRGGGGVVSALGRRRVIHGILVLLRALAWYFVFPHLFRQGEGGRLHYPILSIQHLSHRQSLKTKIEKLNLSSSIEVAMEIQEQKLCREGEWAL